jgi:hypothetical protein
MFSVHDFSDLLLFSNISSEFLTVFSHSWPSGHQIKHVKTQTLNFTALRWTTQIKTSMNINELRYLFSWRHRPNLPCQRIAWRIWTQQLRPWASWLHFEYGTNMNYCVPKLKRVSGKWRICPYEQVVESRLFRRKDVACAYVHGLCMCWPMDEGGMLEEGCCSGIRLANSQWCDTSFWTKTADDKREKKSYRGVDSQISIEWQCGSLKGSFAHPFHINSRRWTQWLCLLSLCRCVASAGGQRYGSTTFALDFLYLDFLMSLSK